SSRCLILSSSIYTFFFIFSFTTPSPSKIYSLSLHDALPISGFVENAFMIPFSTDSLARFFVLTGGSGIPSLPLFSSDIGTPSCKDRKSTRLNSSHVSISYAVFCLKKKRLIIVIYYLYLILRS